jgi:hypothetical protein
MKNAPAISNQVTTQKKGQCLNLTRTRCNRSADFLICRIAELNSAPRGNPTPFPLFEWFADCKSAIRQSATLRYAHFVRPSN